jgi:hypothetical protein
MFYGLNLLGAVRSDVIPTMLSEESL